MSITKTETISEEAYRQFALGDPSGQWELHHGQLREKPGMSVEHGDIMMVLAALLHNQLDRNVFRVRAHHARLRRSADTYYVPDIAIIPTPMERALRERPGSLDAYADPLPLVIEIWSPSTGGMTSTRSCPTTNDAAISRSGVSILMSGPSPHGAEGRMAPIPSRSTEGDRTPGIAAWRGDRPRRALCVITGFSPV